MMTAINEAECISKVMGYEYINGGIWCNWELTCTEPSGEAMTEDWADLMCEMPLSSPNSDTAESEEKYIDENAELIISALNALLNRNNE